MKENQTFEKIFGPYKDELTDEVIEEYRATQSDMRNEEMVLRNIRKNGTIWTN